MRNKPIYILVASLLMLITVLSIPTKADCDIPIMSMSNNNQAYYTDTIVSVYNSHMIETANYQYVVINNSHQLNLTTGEDLNEFEGANIIVSPIREINQLTLLADIFIN